MSVLDSLTLDDYFDEAEALKAISEVGAGRFFRPKKDKTVLRILPPIKANGEKLFYFTHKVHWINRIPYECLNQTLVDKDGKEHLAESCPICALAKRLYKLGEDDEEALKEAKAISAKYRDVVRIILRDEGESKIQFYEMPISVKTLMITAISSGDYGSPPIHPIDGNDFSLQRTGSGTQTKYESSYIMPKKTPIASTKEEIIDILKEAQNMSYNSILSFMDAGSLKKVLREYAGEEDGDINVATRKEVKTPDVGSNITVAGEDLEPNAKEVPKTLETKSQATDKDALDSLLSELTGMDEDIPF